MKNHLTERELIEYQFKLAADDRMKQISEHLKGCGQCRELLEKVQRKFAALDLLRDDVKASDDLIARVTEQAAQPVTRRIVPFRKSGWIGTVAAVILLGLMLFTSDLDKSEKKQIDATETTLSEVGEPKTEEMKPTRDKGTYEYADLDGKEIAEPGIPASKPIPMTEATGAMMADSIGDRAVTDIEEKISEKPPFAPASAIELVTLPRRDNVQLTIYNSADLTLVRERRNLTLKKGWNWLQFMWANTLIDPTSLSLEPMAHADKIDIQQLVFPARLREIGRWLIRSEISGQVPFEITYFTSGLFWRAFYTGTLSRDEKTMHLAGYVRLDNNSGEDYENAQTRLIVGQVHMLDEIADLARRQYPYGSPVPVPGDRSAGMGGRFDYGEVVVYNFQFDGRVGDELSSIKEELDVLRRKEIVKEGLSEYFLYTIEGTETITDKWGKRLLSFEAEDVNVTSLYKYDEERYDNKTIRFVSFANDEEHNLGQTPIPDGNVRIFRLADEQGHLSYVGRTDIKYIPINEEIELNLGPARLVKVEPVLMDYKTDNYVYRPDGHIALVRTHYDKNMNVTGDEFAGFDEIQTWEIELTNTRDMPVDIEITRGFDTAYWTLQTDVPYEKYDATHVRFNLNLEPSSKQKFRYTVTIYHGERQEIMNQ